jgi:L-lysine exporter family protein LysE/ArgO
MITPFIQGFGAGGGLIVAIGAQNAFVLSQGVRKNFHIPIALICILCDAIFISAGVAGFGKVVSTDPMLSKLVALGGAGFLFYYGLNSLRSALRGGNLETNGRHLKSLGTAVLATLAVTLLNPHFYLDTVILLGGISSHFIAEHRIYFWAGAVSASIIWFLMPQPRRPNARPFVQKTHFLAHPRQPGLRYHVDDCCVVGLGKCIELLC